MATAILTSVHHQADSLINIRYANDLARD